MMTDQIKHVSLKRPVVEFRKEELKEKAVQKILLLISQGFDRVEQ
jgi:hypothetical protein